MKTNFQKRLFFGLGISLFLLSLLFLGQRFLASQSVVVKDFQVPVLSDWEMKSVKNENVQFTKTVREDRLVITFRYNNLRRGLTTPKTIEELQKEWQKEQNIATRMMASSDMQVKWLASGQPTDFHNMPAIFIQRVVTGSRTNAQGKMLRFTDGKNLYVLNLNMSSNPSVALSPEAQVEADRAWETITAGLKPI